jgi:hypothetical protein
MAGEPLYRACGNRFFRESRRTLPGYPNPALLEFRSASGYGQAVLSHGDLRVRPSIRRSADAKIKIFASDDCTNHLLHMNASTIAEAPRLPRRGLPGRFCIQ